jgi:hypothetical protein
MESAADALQYRGLSGISDWSVPRICYTLEGFNGWGYRLYHSNVKSPYLWSFSNHYTSGKYTADRKWSPSAVSDQIGAMVLLKFMSSIGLIRIPLSTQDLSVDDGPMLRDKEEYGFGFDNNPPQGEPTDSDDDEEEPSAFDPGPLDLSAEEPYEPHDPTIEEFSDRGEEVRAFWKSRNPRGAILYHRDGRPAVDPELLEASAEGVRAWEVKNPNYRVEMYGPGGGLRASGGKTHNHTPQPRTGRGAAMDFVIIDRATGQMLTNHPGKNHQHQGKVGQNAPLYQSYYNAVVRAGARQFRRFTEKARFGGYFAGGLNAMDIMHIDMRGLEVPTAGGDLWRGFTSLQMRKWRISENRPYRE